MNRSLSLLLALATAAPALAQTPKMGGPMKHIAVQLHGNQLECHVDPLVPMPRLQSYAETYSGAAAVLNGTFYNAQYGWMIEGVWSAPPGASLWIECLTHSPTFEAYLAKTFVPIFGTQASHASILWNGTMLHNWYTTTQPNGLFTASYRIYFGDANAVPLPDFLPGEVVLEWFAGCPADCENDADLDIFDYLCFLDAFSSQDPYADFENDADWDLFDFLAFQNAFAQGCP